MQCQSRAYRIADRIETAANAIAFFAFVGTIVVPGNPASAGVAFASKFVAGVAGVAKIILSKEPINEAVNVFFTFFAGKGAGAAAGKAFKLARKAGLFNIAVERASAFAVRKLGPKTRGVIREFVSEAASKFESFTLSTAAATDEVSTIIEITGATITSAVSRGTNIARGLHNDAQAFRAAKITAARNFVGSSIDRAERFFSSCIAFCGNDQTESPTGGATVSLIDPLVLDLDANGLSLISQKDSSVRTSTRRCCWWW